MPPSAVGTLARTPLAHALVYIRNKRLTGRFELRASGTRGGALTFYRGRISSALVAPPVCFFGSIAYEMGAIDVDMLDRSLLELATSKTKRLHGEVLVEMGALTEAQRDAILHEQVCRKVHHLFTFPDDTQYAFHEVRPGVHDPPMLVDPIAPAWRGLRDYPPKRSIEEMLERVGTATLEMVNEDAVDRARLAPPEAQLAKRLANSPMTIPELRAASSMPRADVDLLVYMLVIAKCVEPKSGARAAPSIGAMPAAAAPSVPAQPVIRATGAQSGAIPAVRPASSTLPPPLRGTNEVPRVLTPQMLGPLELGPIGIAARAKNVGTMDYFAILGIERGASTEAIRAAYLRLAKLWHPDKLPHDLLPFRDEVAAIFAHMTRAQQTLCDPEARRQWMEGQGISPEHRPRERVVREIDAALARSAWDEVEKLSRTLAEADANDSEALALLAWSAARGGNAPEESLRTSLAALDRAVNLDRTCERALYLRGCVAKKLGKHDAAFRDFARVIHLNPRHIEATREVRLFEMRARSGSGEHPLGAVLDRLKGRKDS
jgi:hypothetical protein